MPNRPRPPYPQLVKGLAKAFGKDVLPDVKMAKKRKPTGPRSKPNEMREKKLEKEIIINLQMMGYKAYKSGETSNYNANLTCNGMADIIVFLPCEGVVFLEVKEGKGKQRKTQVEFEKMCKQSFIRYYVVRSKKEAREVLRG